MILGSSIAKPEIRYSGCCGTCQLGIVHNNVEQGGGGSVIPAKNWVIAMVKVKPTSAANPRNLVLGFCFSPSQRSEHDGDPGVGVAYPVVEA